MGLVWEGLAAPLRVYSWGRKKDSHLPSSNLICSALRILLQPDMFSLPHLVCLEFPSCPFLAKGQGAKCGYSLMSASPIHQSGKGRKGMLLRGERGNKKRPRGTKSKDLFHSSAPGLPVYLALLLWLYSLRPHLGTARLCYYWNFPPQLLISLHN